MLVLSRRVGEKLLVDNNVITITRISGNRVTLGIEGPAKVVRAELQPHPAPVAPVAKEQVA